MKQLLLAMCLATPLFGQSVEEFSHTIGTKTAGPLPAKDFWIAIPKIYDTGDSGKSAEIYIASVTATTIHIRGSKFAPVDKKLKPMEQFIYKVETQDTVKSMEMSTSAVKENKGIHIWSDDADLSVNLSIRNAVSAGGTVVLPTTSWGKEYVVAAFEWNEKNGDKPGEFTIVASEDSTQVTIVSPVPLRTSTTQVYSTNTPITLMLNRGEAIQFIAIHYSDYLDISGAVVTSTKPVGVTSAVQYIYIEYAGADFMCEMMPPVCNWGKKYVANGQGNTWYSIIASQENQAIYGYVDLLLEKYKPYFLRTYGSMLFQSDAPFLVTMYSARPSMVCLSPLEGNSRDVIFQFASDTTSNSVDITYNVNARISTKLDGVTIDTIDHHSGIGTRTGYQLAHLAGYTKRVHRITSDSSITYVAKSSTATNTLAWGSTLSPLCINPNKDTIPPVVVTNGDCNHATVSFTDVHPNAAKIMDYVVESLDNLALTADPNFISGTITDSFFYDLNQIDRTKPGMAMISVFDAAGNRTTVTSRISAKPTSTPAKVVIPFAGPFIPNERTFTIKNLTNAPLPLLGPDGWRFASGNEGFALIASATLSDLPPDSSRTFLIRYGATDATQHRDTFIVGRCPLLRIPLESQDVGPIASTTGFDLGCMDVGTSREDLLIVTNAGLDKLTVTSVTIEDAQHFTVLSPTFPYAIESGKRLGVTIRYTPTAADTNCSIAHVITQELGEMTATVCGCGLPQGSVSTDASENREALSQSLREGQKFAWTAPIPNPASSTTAFTFGLAKPAKVTLELFDIDGRRVDLVTSTVYTAGIHEVSVDLCKLPVGSYIYRYMLVDVAYTGKLTIVN